MFTNMNRHNHSLLILFIASWLSDDVANDTSDASLLWAPNAWKPILGKCLILEAETRSHLHFYLPVNIEKDVENHPDM